MVRKLHDEADVQDADRTVGRPVTRVVKMDEPMEFDEFMERAVRVPPKKSR